MNLSIPKFDFAFDYVFAGFDKMFFFIDLIIGEPFPKHPWLISFEDLADKDVNSMPVDAFDLANLYLT